MADKEFVVACFLTDWTRCLKMVMSSRNIFSNFFLRSLAIEQKRLDNLGADISPTILPSHEVDFDVFRIETDMILTPQQSL